MVMWIGVCALFLAPMLLAFHDPMLPIFLQWYHTGNIYNSINDKENNTSMLSSYLSMALRNATGIPILSADGNGSTNSSMIR